jgi:hypothetical protein
MSVFLQNGIEVFNERPPPHWPSPRASRVQLRPASFRLIPPILHNLPYEIWHAQNKNTNYYLCDSTDTIVPRGKGEQQQKQLQAQRQWQLMQQEWKRQHPGQ